MVGVFAKNTSLETKFFVSRLVFFANTSTKHDISVHKLDFYSAISVKQQFTETSTHNQAVSLILHALVDWCANSPYTVLQAIKLTIPPSIRLYLWYTIAETSKFNTIKKALCRYYCFSWYFVCVSKIRFYFLPKTI